MKFSRQTLIWMLVMILVLTAAIAQAFVKPEEKAESYTVSAIVNNSGSSRWTSFREGIEAAAKDYNIRIKFVATGEFTSKKSELEVVSRELEAGADGIILQMYAGGASEDMEELLPREKCVLLETDVVPEEYYQTVGPDNRELGTALAQRIKEDFGGDLSGKTVGILCGNVSQLALRQRMNGAEAVLTEAGATVLWRMAKMSDISEEKALEEYWTMGADIVIALENDETERVVDFLENSDDTRKKIALYGIGNSEKLVYYLDKDVIRALVVPNEFHMGYQSIEELAVKLKYHTAEKRSVRTGYLLIDRLHLYDEENQKILFPIVQ